MPAGSPIAGPFGSAAGSYRPWAVLPLVPMLWRLQDPAMTNNLVRQQPTITSEGALALVRHAIEAGAKAGVPVSVAVVDPVMTLVAFAKCDGATAHSALTSRSKANTASSSRRATGWMGDDLAQAISAATVGALTNIRGGEPLIVDGEVIGGLGIAGGTPAQDAEIAAAAVGACLKQS